VEERLDNEGTKCAESYYCSKALREGLGKSDA
jgi:hypothetical protein